MAEADSIPFNSLSSGNNSKSLDYEHGGYDPSIFDADTVDDKYLCNECKKVLRDPVQAPCGHRLCRMCSEALFGWVFTCIIILVF